MTMTPEQLAEVKKLADEISQIAASAEAPLPPGIPSDAVTFGPGTLIGFQPTGAAFIVPMNDTYEFLLDGASAPEVFYFRNVPAGVLMVGHRYTLIVKRADRPTPTPAGVSDTLWKVSSADVTPIGG